LKKHFFQISFFEKKWYFEKNCFHKNGYFSQKSRERRGGRNYFDDFKIFWWKSGRYFCRHPACFCTFFCPFGNWKTRKNGSSQFFVGGVFSIFPTLFFYGILYFFTGKSPEKWPINLAISYFFTFLLIGIATFFLEKKWFFETFFRKEKQKLNKIFIQKMFFLGRDFLFFLKKLFLIFKKLFEKTFFSNFFFWKKMIFWKKFLKNDSDSREKCSAHRPEK